MGEGERVPAEQPIRVGDWVRVASDPTPDTVERIAVADDGYVVLCAHGIWWGPGEYERVDMEDEIADAD